VDTDLLRAKVEAALDAADLPAIDAALVDVPRAAYSVPFVYPSASPDFSPAPMQERFRPPVPIRRQYVHVPFCSYRCSFCSFAVRVGASDDLKARYVDAVLRELEWVDAGSPLTQLYVGGGTPTALPVGELERLLTGVMTRYADQRIAVHTVETSPETVTREHLDVIRSAGVGRVSMGVQSLDTGVLDTVNRRQSRQQSLDGIALVLDHGLLLNIDLIYGLPGQTPDMFAADVAELAAHGVEGFTFYSLRANDRSFVEKALADDERFTLPSLARWRLWVDEVAGAHGFVQTRGHTYKKAASSSLRHRRESCFDGEHGGYQHGAGLSARSHLGHTVYRNTTDMNEYLRRIDAGVSPVEEVFVLEDEDRRTQFIGRALGDAGVLSLAEYRAAFGMAFTDDYAEITTRLADAALLAVDDDAVVTTRMGRALFDIVTLAYYPAKAQHWLQARLSPVDGA
jgi:oxygen-independent coproporphyrinogen-3 oxidase